ncbi:CRISPR-associated endonuclease Cas2 [Acidithiobacillus caldus]|jgi:CRISPR-associated protein Cas2|uniref:CRISPR-associated endoribonuclease Cas2 n=1 Tax=Acidithiobacillus caldus TaxID=33059 RepID=A0A1E7YKT1_9PROT|nr:CRISPR-associated endonuclease Cas2 [Acidithiobacillus caldus]OFC30307.1 CRISPR-associated endonuclease Cas2 [Acidithiobacillus caldus]OFC37598.1 CRISPR-associated endonuclease Cas2 [Acidithiobacillus caldus]OFC39185.1 CRISPR-associated endonuclease Cas2 [Acidithiobacillus caldus]
MLIVVTYDIASDRARNRVAKLLLGWGERVQKSVYECRIDTPSQWLALREKVAKHLDVETDTVRYYSLCDADRVEISTDGYQEYREESDFYLL